jgi:predicted nucleotidyltransferase component of viral defense system
MMLSRDQLQRAAADGGFQIESYEKVHMLIDLLQSMRAHPFLGHRMALKGGTALNLFVLDFPRLSVDIDLNYIGASDRATTVSERPRVEQALEQVFGRLGLAVKRTPTEHAGGKWRLSYASALGKTGTLEVDVNFMLRTPLWPVTPRDSHSVGGLKARQILVLDEHELAAGKLAALVARSASRDLFDACALLRRSTLDPTKLRLGFIVYGGANREDWRSVAIERVVTTAADVDAQLLPMLRTDVRPKRHEVAAWTDSLIQEARSLLSIVLPLTEQEREFLEQLNGKGDIIPELLTGDPVMQEIIRSHPGLNWKAVNVKRRVGAAALVSVPDDRAAP